MATCNDCIHLTVCRKDLAREVRAGRYVQLADCVENFCYDFIDKPSVTGGKVEVIRCADCKFHDPKTKCRNNALCIKNHRYFADYDYCSLGEKR